MSVRSSHLEHVRLSKGLADGLRSLAREKGIPISELVKRYLADGLRFDRFARSKFDDRTPSQYRGWHKRKGAS